MASENQASLPCLSILMLGRVHPLAQGRTLHLKLPPTVQQTAHVPPSSYRHVQFTQHGKTISAQSRSASRLRVRGESRSEWRLETGDVVYVDRIPALVVETGFSKRFPAAIRWLGFVANDAVSFKTMLNIASAASSHAPLCLWGESGTGKEVAARAVHACGPRAKGPWVAVNCAALPSSLAEAEFFGVVRGAYTGADKCRPGAFQRAHGGTLFLDEIAELDPLIQAKLLRVLQSGEVKAIGATKNEYVDVRIVTATWRDLDALSAVGDFRLDLLHRLWVLRVQVPPLRDRRGDVGPLVESFFHGLDADDMYPPADMLSVLERAHWEGNIRQLSNHVHRAVVWGEPERLLPKENRESLMKLARRGQIPDLLGIDKVRRTLAHTRGNRSAAARRLGISRSTLYRWLEREPTLQITRIEAIQHHRTA